MKSIIRDKKILTIIYYSFIILYVLIAFAVAFFSIGIFGFSAYTNTSDSMDPVIKKGSVVIVHKKDNNYDIGDIISYYALVKGQEEIVTHRIVGRGGNVYLTKGDSNQFVDRIKVVPRLIIGKVVLVLPNLGIFIKNAQNRVLIDLFFIIPALFIITIEVKKIKKLLN